MSPKPIKLISIKLDDIKNFAELSRYLRKTNHLSLVALARKLGKSKGYSSYLHNIEMGVCIPSIEIIKSYIYLFDLSNTLIRKTALATAKEYMQNSLERKVSIYYSKLRNIT